MLNLGGNFGLKFLNLFSGLPLQAKSGSFSPRLSIANAIMGSTLQMQCQCPADPNTSHVIS